MSAVSSMAPTPALAPVPGLVHTLLEPVGVVAEPVLLEAAPSPGTSFSRKRQAEDGANGPGPAKRAAKTPDVVFRLLVPAGKIGKVIGKQGMQIKQLREETLAHIKIADSISTTEDRVVIISSKEEDDTSEKTAAEKALLRVTAVLLEEASSGSVGTQHHAPNLTRLLISGSQAGSLIGKGGATIKEIREGSSANVRVLPSERLPLCSAATDTDRLVQISGDMHQVHSALELVAAKLRENPPREHFSPRPTYVMGMDAAGRQLLLPHPVPVYGLAPPPHPANAAAYGAYAGLVGQTPALPFYPAMPPTPVGPVNVNPTPVAASARITAEMSVPNSLMGGIIGRGGANISQIRSMSGASIKAHGPKEGSSERIISFEGSQEQVSAAQSLVRAFLNAPR